ncbi:MAG: hypothetical protein IJU20_02250 [Clostridia bacterium]|nr:hypothetical protein [Clostridia bacterium]
MIRIISFLLSAVMLLTAFAVLSVFQVAAAEETEIDVSNLTGSDLVNYLEAYAGYKTRTEKNSTANPFATETFIYNTPDEKLALFGDPYFVSSDGVYEMYVFKYNGEIALRNTLTGQILFTNPYDASTSIASDSTKNALFSQVVIRYTDNDTQKFMYSFSQAAMNGQITTRKIKNGVRVEYIIGDQAQRKLVPRLITKERFDTLILEPLTESRDAGLLSEFSYSKFKVYYSLYDLDEMSSEKSKAAALRKFPALANGPIYVFDPDARAVEVNLCEDMIKTYAPLYTFDMMDEDHEMTGYVSEDDKSPVFRLSLEYTLDEDGMVVRLPTNGIRFDSSAYAIEYISILPYMGAGHSDNTGYTFYPDGSGALFRFEDLNNKTTTTISRKVYGTDYAYHVISGTYQKTVRYPVFGIVQNSEFLSYTDPKTEEDVTTSVTIKTREELTEEVADLYDEDITSSVTDVGFVGILEEGESLADIATYHAGSLSDYNTIMTYFNPRPKDSYDLSDSISVTTSSTWTVVSNRKYTGDYKIRYIMLADDNLAKSAGLTDYYPCTWLGMAQAYRNYLVKKGVLNRLNYSDVYENIPLYIETFGALQVTEQILSFPVNVMKPLTTFENLVTMYEDLSAAGINNVNFQMVGYANGGMYSRVPYKLKWERAVQKGEYNFKELLDYAQNLEDGTKTAHMGLYPDFDFVYVNAQKSFDGLSLKRDAIRTIDNRYTGRRTYSASQQKYLNFFELAISASQYSRFYTKFLEKYLKYDVQGISVSTLGTELNSDFDEDDPYNREDAKAFTKKALAYIEEKVPSVMLSGGNVYTWQYADHIVDAYLESSKYVKASNVVPFLGVVLHGYIQFAGSPLNMEGDTGYSMLKTIENGAGVYFVLSYQNTEELKEDYQLSRYYSIRYDIWKDDVISMYSELNAALKDLQTKPIIAHQFLPGVRVLDLDELQADIKQVLDATHEQEVENDKNAAMELISKVGAARLYAKNSEETLTDILAEAYTTILDIDESVENLQTYIKNVDVAYSNYQKALASAGYNENASAVKVMYRTYTARVGQLENVVINSALAAETITKLIEDAQEVLDTIAENIEMLIEVEGGETIMVTEMRDYLEAAKAIFENGLAVSELMDDSSSEEVITFNDLLEKSSAYTGVKNDVAEQVTDENGQPMYTVSKLEELIDEARKKRDKDNQSEEVKTETEEENKYLVNNGNIVAVTYGGKGGIDQTAYKTFILNYNAYTVHVTYNSVEYTIPSGEYVMIYH